jgi:hypothetical protein
MTPINQKYLIIFPIFPIFALLLERVVTLMDLV